MSRSLGVSVLICLAAWSQTSTGNISGSVEDATGARVPNAKVTITHLSTQQSRIVSTNERGEYLASLMPIGEYVVQVRGKESSANRSMASSCASISAERSNCDRAG